MPNRKQIVEGIKKDVDTDKGCAIFLCLGVIALAVVALSPQERNRTPDYGDGPIPTPTMIPGRKIELAIIEGLDNLADMIRGTEEPMELYDYQEP